ncbi:hypothetical protein ABPG74_015243 [Tetrahymena malaccensis]
MSDDVLGIVINTLDEIILVAFSADCKYLVTGHTSSVLSVNFSSNTKYLATTSQDIIFKIWNALKELVLVYTIQQNSPVNQDDQTSKIWNIDKGIKLLKVFKEKQTAIKSVTFFCRWSLRFNFFVAFSQDGKFLVTGSSDKTCKVWNTEKGFELIDTIKGYTKQIDAITFSSDNQYIATGSDDKTCKIWNEKKGFESINQIKNHSKQIYSVAFSPDGKYLVTCSRDNA